MNWHKYLDEDYEDAHEKIERIKHPPKKYDDDEKKTVLKRDRPRNVDKS